MEKKDLLRDPIQHIDIKTFDAAPIIDSMRNMSFTARDTTRAADLLNRMLEGRDCTIILCFAGSTSAAGYMQIYVDMVRRNMVDAIVAAGASIVDMDFLRPWAFGTTEEAPPRTIKGSESSTSTGFMTPSPALEPDL